MIVTVRRWTSLALPRLRARVKSTTSEAPTKRQAPVPERTFLESFHKMYEHQVNLMFKDDLQM